MGDGRLVKSLDGAAKSVFHKNHYKHFFNKKPHISSVLDGKIRETWKVKKN